MKLTTKLGLLAVMGALAVAGPAIAKDPHSGDPGRSSGHERHHGEGSHRCAAHPDAYIAIGTIVTWGATAGSDGTYSGTVVITVTHANHHASGADGSNQTYTLTNVKVHFGDGANPPAAGDRIKLIGKISAVARHCTDQTGAGTITVRQLRVSLPIQHT